MMILHDQLSSFKEGGVVPVQRKFFLKNMEEPVDQFQREFFSENMKEPVVQFPKESISEMKDVLMRMQSQNICDDDLSLFQNAEDSEAVAWRTVSISDGQRSQKWLYILCTWLTWNLISGDSVFGSMSSVGALSSLSISLWNLWNHLLCWLESCQVLMSLDGEPCYFRIPVADRSGLLQHPQFSASMMISNLSWRRGSYCCRSSVDDNVVHLQCISSAVVRRIYYLLWIRDVCLIVVLNVSLAEREC